MIEPLIEAEQLLVMGVLDQAEQIYRRTAEADPRNAIAVVGLARVAVERGDDALAYSYALDALRIDPEDAFALRLEARLSEVLAARGEPVERPSWLAVPGAPVPSPRAPVTQPPVAPAAPPADDLGAQAQRAALARNPSMADHRRRMTESRPPAPPESAPPESAPPEPAPPESASSEPASSEHAPSATSRRAGLLRRLLGR